MYLYVGDIEIFNFGVGFFFCSIVFYGMYKCFGVGVYNLNWVVWFYEFIDV